MSERHGETEGLPEAEGGIWDLADGSRRDFLKLMGFSVGAAALASCTPIPQRQAVPPLSLPEGAGAALPGVETYYATTCGGCGAGCGLLAKTRDGRPIKIEGNPSSPVSGGATCAAGQATVLSLYDDGRLKGPLLHGKPVSWAEADAFVAPRLAAIAARANGGNDGNGGLALLTGTVHSPSHRKLIADFLARHPGSRHAVWEPVSLAALREANRRSFGRAAVPHFRLDRAKVVVGLEADFLGTWLSPVEFARAWARARRPETNGARLRHWQVESGLSLTGGAADRRIAVLPSELGLAALGLLRRVAQRAGQPIPPSISGAEAPDAGDPAALDALADDLWRHRGESLVLCGANDLAVQAVANRLNALLGNVGRTVDLDRPSLQNQGDEAAVAALIEAMERGEVHGLVLWGVNPAYDHPQAARFVRALENVALKVSLSGRLDETAALADAVCPDHHFLESWGDAEPVEGCFGLRQPTISPLFDTRAAAESLLRWMGMGQEKTDAYAHLREHWRTELHPRQTRWTGFDDFWDHSLQDGACELPAAAGTGTAAVSTADAGDLVAAAAAILRDHREARSAGGCEVLLHQKVGILDGREANNPWLQELPDPVTRLAWGNQAAVSPALAAELSLEDGDVVALRRGGSSLELPVVVQPGLPKGAVAVALGYGRTRAGKVADGLGANAFPWVDLRGGFARGWTAGAALAKTGRSETLAAIQRQATTEGRPIVRTLTAAELDRKREEEPAQSLWAEWPREGHHWGMAIDLDACTGCSACVVACQSENNVPVVGPEEMARGREMHWIRIDRYYEGEGERSEMVHQPMMCQHCGNAPCETVCPVLATVHSTDGLNQQVYNRCVGTRYCENNCPYKVRRFNWFKYAGNPKFDYNMNSDLGRMVLNPDVVVRSRGVMEKCSLCIQRIQAGKLRAETAGTKLADGEVRTACQQACPSEAIVFGDLADPASEVSHRHASPRFYRVLEELNTRPVVGYLARVKNLPDGEGQA